MDKKRSNASKRAFLSTILILFVLMVTAYAMAVTLPKGQYTRIQTPDGLVIDPNEPFRYIEAPSLPLWKFATSIFLLFTTDAATSLIGIAVLLLISAGTSGVLDECGMIKSLINRAIVRFRDRKYMAIAVLVLVFMLLGSFAGFFEEILPFIPLLISLSIAFGFDGSTGVAIALLSVSCGFACAIANPFTLGIAQGLAGLQIADGLWQRIVSFVVIYGLLSAFIFLYAKKHPNKRAKMDFSDYAVTNDKRYMIFLLTAAGCFLAVVCCSLIPGFSSYTTFLIMGVFLILAIESGFLMRMGFKNFMRSFFLGAMKLLPSLIFVFMAYSVKFILEEGMVLDTIVHICAESLQGVHPSWIVFFLFIIALVINFFIPSGSAEVMLLFPIFSIIATQFSVPLNVCIMAILFGDGFSNVIYPTNPVLDLSLSIADISYLGWLKKIWPFVLILFIASSALLMVLQFVR